MIPAKGFRVSIASLGRISSLDDGVWGKRILLASKNCSAIRFLALNG